MLERIDPIVVARNLFVYAVGVGFAVAGALGLVGAIAIHAALSAALFVVGLALVLAVHEYLGGPV